MNIFITNKSNGRVGEHLATERELIKKKRQDVKERVVENYVAKLLQKSEMRKDIVIELSYKGFG